MTSSRDRAIARAVLTMVAAGKDVPAEYVEKAKAITTPTKLDEERLRRSAEKRERKARRKERSS